MISIKIAIAFSISISVVYGWLKPSAEYLNDFAEGHGKPAIVIYLPEFIPSQWIKWHKKIQMLQLRPVLYRFPYLVSSDNASFSNENELHVYIPDDQKLKESLDHFLKIYSSRTNTNNEWWLLDISFWATLNEALTSLQDLKLDLDDDLYLYSFSSSVKKEDKLLNIWEFYEIHPSRPRKALSYGNWSESQGLMLEQTRKWIRRQNLDGINIRALSVPFAPYITKMSPINQNGDEYEIEGLAADFLLNLQDTLNFTYTMKRPSDNSWGSLNPDGTWTGIVGELHTDQADIGVQAFALTLERSTAVSYPQSIVEVYYQLFIKNPTGSYNYLGYVYPLRYYSWIFVGLFLLWTPPFLYLTSKHSINKSGEKDLEDNGNEFSMGKTVVFVLSCLGLRRWSIAPTKIPVRIAFFIIMIFGTVLSFYWRAMLTSSLAKRVIVLPFDSMATLLTKSDFQIAINPKSADEDAFRLSTDPVWMEAWNDRIKPYLEDYNPYYANARATSIPVENPSIALYRDFVSMSSYSVYSKCEVLAIPEKYRFTPCGFILQKNSPYLAIIDYYLKEMKEKGLSEQILAKYDPGEQICQDSSGEPIGFDSCFTAFLALIGGLGLGLILFLVESMAPNLSLLQMYDRKDINNDDFKNHNCNCDNCKIMKLKRNFFD